MDEKRKRKEAAHRPVDGFHLLPVGLDRTVPETVFPGSLHVGAFYVIKLAADYDSQCGFSHPIPSDAELEEFLSRLATREDTPADAVRGIMKVVGPAELSESVRDFIVKRRISQDPSLITHPAVVSWISSNPDLLRDLFEDIQQIDAGIRAVAWYLASESSHVEIPNHPLNRQRARRELKSRASAMDLTPDDAYKTDARTEDALRVAIGLAGAEFILANPEALPSRSMSCIRKLLNRDLAAEKPSKARSRTHSFSDLGLDPAETDSLSDGFELLLSGDTAAILDYIYSTATDLQWEAFLMSVRGEDLPGRIRQRLLRLRRRLSRDPDFNRLLEADVPRIDPQTD